MWADVAETGEIFGPGREGIQGSQKGLVRIAGRCSVRLHNGIVENDEIAATVSKNFLN